MSYNTNNNQSKDIQVIQFIIEDLQKRNSQDKLLKYNVKDKINTILRKRDFKVNKQLILDIIKSIDIYIDRLEKSKIGNQPIQKNKVNQPSFLNSPISSLLTNSNFTNNTISNNKVGSGILTTSIINNNKEGFKNTLIHNMKERDLYIDSKDRDYEKYEFPNDYTINLEGLGLTNIKKLELKEVIIIKSEKDPQSSDAGFDVPYLVVNIDGLSNTSGTNEYLKDNFAILKNYEENGRFKYFKEIDTSFSFNNGYNLKELKIKFVLPNGELFNFGFNNNLSYHTVNFLHFKVYL